MDSGVVLLIAALLLACGLSLAILGLGRRALDDDPSQPPVRVFGIPSPLLTLIRYRRLPMVRDRAAWRPPTLAALLSPLIGPPEPAPAIVAAASDDASGMSVRGLLRDLGRRRGLNGMRAGAMAVCLAITFSIGITFARSIRGQGWELWAWLIAILVCAAALLPLGRLPRLGHIPWAWLAVLFATALLLRATALNHIPPGLHPDEAGVATFTVLHVYPESGSTLYPFRAGFNSQPTLFQYIIRFSLDLAGYSIAGLRLSSALAGALAVLATFAAVSVLDNRRTGLLAAILMATYHFHIHWSRLALNNIWDTLWAPLVLGALAWGWRRDWSGGAVISGLALGLSQYFYAGSKLVILLLAFTVWRMWRQEPNPRRLVVHMGKLLVMAACVAAPIAMHILLDPGPYFARWNVSFGWHPETVRAVMGGQLDWWGYAWHQIWHSLGAFTVFPDTTGFYGPGVPFLFGPAAILFVVGLVWAAYKRIYTPILWIGLTVIFGGILLAAAPSSSHYVVSIPAICWLVAVPLNGLIEHGRWRLALALLLVVSIADLGFYFLEYIPGSPPDLDVPIPTPLGPP